mmetsp:Transcript_46425/g.110328  ORF Transcript_46425/g.110328 Transcript_46425/m.110328 type:complete len:213 (+) Transcript_46425:563-1201(+)
MATTSLCHTGMARLRRSTAATELAIQGPATTGVAGVGSPRKPARTERCTLATISSNSATSGWVLWTTTTSPSPTTAARRSRFSVRMAPYIPDLVLTSACGTTPAPFWTYLWASPSAIALCRSESSELGTWTAGTSPSRTWAEGPCRSSEKMGLCTPAHAATSQRLVAQCMSAGLRMWSCNWLSGTPSVCFRSCKSALRVPSGFPQFVCFLSA